MRSKRQSALLFGMLLAGFAAGYLLFRGRAPAPVTVALVAPALEAPPAAAPAATRAPARGTAPGAPRAHAGAVPTAKATPAVRSLGRMAADDYRHRARFPASSQPIADDVDPIVRDREVTKGHSFGPEGQHPTLIVYPARTSFEAPQPVVLHAYLVDDGDRVPADVIAGEVRDQDGASLAALQFRDDGLAGDAEADDLIFTAVLAPQPEEVLALKGSRLVLARAETFDGAARIATTGFLYSVPLARLTGRYRDRVRDGNLEVAAEVAVAEAGQFHLEATLAASDGTPLAWAQYAVALDPGLSWIPLTYWGLIFHEAQVPGPYVLRSVALSTTGEMPNQKNDVVTDAHVTQPYAVAAFSNQPFDDPDLLEAAQRLESDTPFAPSVEAGGP
jgi:hypothetical protein